MDTYSFQSEGGEPSRELDFAARLLVDAVELTDRVQPCDDPIGLVRREPDVVVPFLKHRIELRGGAHRKRRTWYGRTSASSSRAPNRSS